jgi:hypothetical protein
VFVSPADRYSYSVGIDGTTTTNGDLGARLNLAFLDKNIFRGAETFRLGANTAYEARRETYDYFDENKNDTVARNRWQHSYSVGAEASLTLPQILLPLKQDARRRYGGTTTISLNYRYQNLIKQYIGHFANASMSYNWQQRSSRYSFTLIDLGYVFLPWRSDSFIANYMKFTSISRYSFEDHLITKIGFEYSNTSRRGERSAQSFYTFRGVK